MVGPQELLIILVIVLLLFGSTQIPRLMKGLGQGIHEFKKGVTEGAKEEEEKEKKAAEEQKKADASKPPSSEPKP